VFSFCTFRDVKIPRDAPADFRAELSVLGAEMYDAQNPIVLEHRLLDEFLPTPKARAAFERIAAEYAAPPRNV
jgi:hypothetical protein